MKINVDRLCTLAGIEGNSRSGILRESARYEGDGMTVEDADMSGDTIEELYEDEDGEDQDEMQMIDVDEVMLVQELRRAKKIMLESKRVEKRRKENLLEAELKTIVESEVEKVMRDLNLNSDWFYGGKKPTRSRNGYTHQGSFLKGIGFK